MARARNRDDGSHLLHVQEILRTGHRASFGTGETKVMRFVLQGTGADLEVSGRAFTIRFDWNSSRHRYFMDLAPGVVSALLDWCQSSHVTEPRAARFPAERVPRVGYLRAPWPSIDRDVWFLPGPSVQIFVRQARPGAPSPIPSNPPLPLRAQLRTVVLASPHVCPHCRTEASSYRNLVTAWVCSACARSFPVGATEIGSILETEEPLLPN